MERLNEQQMEIIKKYEITKYVIDSERYGISIPDSAYKELTGIDMATLDKMYGETHVYNEVRYCSLDGGFELHYETIINDSFNAELSGVFECDDFLGLFSTKEEKQTVEDFFNDNMEEVVRKLKECYPDVVSCLKEEIINELTADDISEELKEEIIDDYFSKEDSSDILDRAWDNADDSDIRDKVVSYIQYNL